MLDAIIKKLRGIGVLKRSPTKGILFYVGLYKGDSFDVIYRGYEQCFGFEANKELFDRLVEKYAHCSNVHLFNVAVGERAGTVDFHISSNDGASSSLGQFDPQWIKDKLGKVEMVRTAKVPCINLMEFCISHGIEYIDDYASDIQGMDLAVLKTLKPMIDTGNIGTVTCEVSKDERRNSYGDLPDNSESGFKEFLSRNYELVAKGSGVLTEGVFEDVPADWWEMDCKWRCKVDRKSGQKDLAASYSGD